MTRSQQYGEGLEGWADKQEEPETPNAASNRSEVSPGITKADYKLAQDVKNAVVEVAGKEMDSVNE
ncbi:MAG: hypothetical protein KBD00_01405 [Candidatus Peribacteraceae bacterium]|nr:hypothetical protein [Candidatus Peribacteraceae bacterium]